MKVSRMARMNQIIQIVREKKEISVYELSALLGLSPSTIFQYVKVMPYLFDDIEYSRGVLRYTGSE